MKRCILPAILCLACSCSDLNLFDLEEVHYWSLGFLNNELNDSVQVRIYPSPVQHDNPRDFILRKGQQADLFTYYDKVPDATVVMAQYFDSIRVSDFSGHINLKFTALIAINYVKNPFSDKTCWQSYSTSVTDSKDLVTHILTRVNYTFSLEEEYLIRTSTVRKGLKGE